MMPIHQTINNQKIFTMFDSTLSLLASTATTAIGILAHHRTLQRLCQLPISFIMANPESQESMEYSVGGLQPFKEARAQHFLVEVLGRRERIPMKLDLNEGAKEIEMRMRARYSAAYLQDCARLFKNQLESSDEDQEI